MYSIVKGLLAAVVVGALAAPAGIASAAVAPAGEPAGETTPTIIGGTNATETYSFMAHLSSSQGWGCGAVLIRPTWIATARHCVTGDRDMPSPPNTLTFRIGTLQENSGGVVAKAKRVIRYDGRPEADAAIVELTAPVAKAPINIATSAPVGSPIRIIGWGCIRDPGCQAPATLQQLDTSVLPDNRCGGGRSYLCINNPDGWRGACYGDSGGPAVLRSTTGAWVLGGTTSGGTSAICGQGPSVYVEVPNLRAWIESYAGPDGGGYADR